MLWWLSLLLILLDCWLDGLICSLFFHVIGRAGNMNMGIYEADCEFADPFVSFKGLKRFKQNVSNLGSFMEESSLKITDWQEYEVQNLLQVSSNQCHLHDHYPMWFLETMRLLHDLPVLLLIGSLSAAMDSLPFILSLCPCRIGSTPGGVSIASWDFLGVPFWQVRSTVYRTVCCVTC